MNTLPMNSLSFSNYPEGDLGSHPLSELGATLFHQSREVIFAVRLRDGRILEANPAAEYAYGYSHDELLQLTVADLRAPETHAAIQSQMQQANTIGIFMETLHQRKDGSIFPVEVNSFGTVVDNEQANLSIVRDISVRKANDRLFQRVIASLSEMVIVQQPESRVIQLCSPAAERMLGYKPEELLGKTPRVIYESDEVYEGIGRRIRADLNTTGSFHTEICLRRKDGTIIFAEMNVTEVCDETRQRIGFVSSFFDITERKLAEQARADSEERYRKLVEAAPLGLHLYDLQPDGRLIFTGANPAADHILGIDHQAMIGLPIEDAFPPHRQSDIPALYRQVAQEGTPYACEQVAYQDNKIQGIFEIHAFQTRESSIAVFFQDITAKKKAEQDLRESEERYRLLFSSGNDAVFVYPLLDNGMPGLFTEVNEIACQRLGYTREELLKKGFVDINFAERISTSPRLIEELRKNGQLLATAEHRTKSGEAIPVEVNSRIFKIGRKTMVISVARDITERQQAERKMSRQVKRLSALRAIDQSILTAKDLNETLDILLEQITHTLEVDRANILLYDPEKKNLRIARARGLPAEPTWLADTPLAGTHPGKAIWTHNIEFIPELSDLQDRLTRRIEQIGEHFSSYLAVPLEAKGELKGVLQLFHRERLNPDEDWSGFLRALADQAAIAIDSAQLFYEQQQTNARLTKAYEDTIDGWSRALDLRDEETEGHSKRVTDLTLELARRMGVADEQLIHIRRGARLHDIGKMGIPDAILLKEGTLTQEEWLTMRQHPTFAANLLRQIEFLGPAIEIPYGHHEKWDGSGYPQGLRGETIPLSARIFAVIDVWDALTHDRPYRLAWSDADALAYIREQASRHFDPRVVQEFLVLMQSNRPV